MPQGLAELSSSLPPVVQAYVRRVLPATAAAPDRVRLTQRGTMWRAPNTRGMDFTAEQALDVHRVGFDWRARFRVLPGIWIAVEDVCADDRGHLEVRLWGRVRVAREDGPRLARGEIQRYLGELAWVPFAIAHNRVLTWRELGPRRVEVAAPAASAEHAVELGFDDAGDIVEISAKARPYGTGARSIDRPWGARYLEHAVMDGVRIPVRAEAWWDLPEGRFTYWRGEVTSWTRRAWARGPR